MRVHLTLLLLLAGLLSAATTAAQERPAATPIGRAITGPTRTPATATAEEAARKMFLAGIRGSMAAPSLQSDFRLSPHAIPAAMRAGGYTAPAIVEGLVTGLRAAPAEAAGWMLQNRHTAGETAVGLRSAGLDDVQVMTALRAAGVDVSAAAGATSALGIDEPVVGRTLARAGYPVVETRSALRSAGIASDPVLERPEACFTWEGEAVCPGGAAPGASWSQTMGQVDWEPRGEGRTGATLTIESTNIPQVEVRLGTIPLDLLEASSTRVRARLPDAPVTADLALVRALDGAIGTLEVDYRVVAPPEAPAAWAAWSVAAREAALGEIRAWILQARIQGPACTVAGAAAHGGPGVLGSGHSIGDAVRRALDGAGAPVEVAVGWDTAWRAAWRAWADRVTVPGLPWYPGFLAFPGPQAPPTPNVPMPLALLVSAGVTAMSHSGLVDRIEAALGPAAEDADASAAIDAFAQDLSARFTAWSLQAQVVNVLGSGPVPAYDPEGGVPAGPVMGTCTGGALAGPAF